MALAIYGSYALDQSHAEKILITTHLLCGWRRGHFGKAKAQTVFQPNVTAVYYFSV